MFASRSAYRVAFIVMPSVKPNETYLNEQWVEKCVPGLNVIFKVLDFHAATCSERDSLYAQGTELNL
jgi:hypothetical protein